MIMTILNGLILVTALFAGGISLAMAQIFHKMSAPPLNPNAPAVRL